MSAIFKDDLGLNQINSAKMIQKSLLKNFMNILFLSVPLLIFSCNNSGTGSKKDNNQAEVQQIVPAPVAAASENDIMKRGEVIYKKACLVCHQADGSGVPMMFPPITESEIIAGSHEELIKIILDGMSGPVEIKGEKYNSVMPPLKNDLDDQEVADLLTYIRNSFGNSGDTIKAEEVAAIRK